jgi:hypothetical protein
MARRKRRWPAKSLEARGYGWPHRTVRERCDPIVQTGSVACAHCGHVIAVGAPWDLAHNSDRSAWIGPAHRYCNRSDGAKVGNALRAPRRSSREW